MKTKLFTTILLSSLILFASAQIIHVPEDYLTIQGGINVASAGDTVLVAEGNYYENINFKGKAITVASNFIMGLDTSYISNTIINGSQPINADSASVVAFVSGEDTTSVISGFTITDGSGLYDALLSMRIGGGIVCKNSGAKIVHNRILDNEVDNQFVALGAGIGCLIYTENHWIVIENNIIANNYNHVIDNGAFGGGIYIGENTGSGIEINARVGLNTIENNYCYGELYRADGGGIKIEGGTGVTTKVNFYNNLVQNNSIRSLWTRGAGFCGLGAEAVITNNIFLNNNIDSNSINFRGAAICFKLPNGKLHIVDNHFSNNVSPLICESGTGAVSIMDGYENQVIIDRNTFTNNTGQYGGGFYSRRSYNLCVSNNIFSCNSAIKGGALTLFHPSSAPLFVTIDNSPLLINNTFAGNSAIDGGGAIRFSGEVNSPIIINSIFWQNSAPSGFDIINESPLNIQVFYSDIDINNISGLYEGEENINLDPHFVDPLNGDFHLEETSPCAGKGINELSVLGILCCCPPVDMENDPRPMPFNLMPDMGADEVNELASEIPKINSPVSSFQLSNYPNPFSNSTTIEFDIVKTGFTVLSIYGLTGKLHETIISMELTSGNHKIKWNADGLPAGIYFLRLETNERSETRKLVILR